MSGCVTTTGAILCADNALVNCSTAVVTFYPGSELRKSEKIFIPILIKKIRVRVILE